MSLEISTQGKNIVPDYDNEEVILGILEVGDLGELKKIAEEFNFSEDQINRFSKFAQLRKKIIGEMRRELESRIEKGINPTEEELNLGAYKEVLEPQVREAVFILRKKGYPTFESGFADLEGDQTIGLTEPVIGDGVLDKSLLDELLVRGIKVVLSPNLIKLEFSEFVSLDEIKDAWIKVAMALPDLGVATPNKVEKVKRVNYSGFFIE